MTCGIFCSNIKNVEKNRGEDMKKILLKIITIIFTVGILSGCGTEKSILESEKEIKMIVPDGLPAIASAKLIKENKEIIDGYKISYSIEKTPENIVSEVLKGDADIAIVPSNVSATQYNKGANYRIAATVGWGSLYLISTQGNKNIEELRNEEIYNIGKGLTPDLITRSLLKDNGVDSDKDVNFSYVNGVTELAPTIIAGKTNYAIIPEPALTQVQSKNKNISILIELNEEWKRTNNSEYGFPQSTVIVKEDLIKEDKEFVQEFLKELEESTTFAKNKNEKLPEYCEEIGVSANKEIILNAIEKANLNFVEIQKCSKEYDIYFNKLNELDPSSIGGKIPNEEVYMEE